MRSKKDLKKKKVKLDSKTLELYDKLSFICGIFSILLTLTGLFGIIIGFLGICLSVTYYAITCMFYTFPFSSNTLQ